MPITCNNCGTVRTYTNSAACPECGRRDTASYSTDPASSRTLQELRHAYNVELRNRGCGCGAHCDSEFLVALMALLDSRMRGFAYSKDDR